MSSVRRRAIILAVLLSVGTAGSAQYNPQYAPQPQAAAPSYSGAAVGYALNDWRRLRQSSGYSFTDYARFLNANPDWPAETTMRRWAERQMQPGEHGPTVLAFYARQ